MTALNKITGAASSKAPHRSEGADAPQALHQSGAVRPSPLWSQPSNLTGEAGAPSTLPNYSHGTARCGVCDVHEQDACEECEGLGKVDCACADCGRVVALNDDGLCQRCSDSDTLPIAEFQSKYLCGWARAEAAALGGKHG